MTAQCAGGADMSSARAQLDGYFEAETSRIEAAALDGIETAEDWNARAPELRRELFFMLGLDPLPKRTDLQAEVTAVTETDDVVIERLHFQSLPGLYVTANFYLPRERSEPLPAVLYVCGHGGVKVDGVSFGNKVTYHHHGLWFARNGYACLVIDTIQLGELEGIHHGTYREKMWWWNSRGYTPAGVEAWNSIRALDYLESRPEVDASRIGVTGRSGGGAYSWWVATLDDRIKAAAPVAGITSLRNHVVDDCVEGHCDCMFMLNAARWDFPLVSALVAPRPLLIVNTDKDSIFPLDGVQDVHEKTRRIYRLLDADDKLGLQISEGPHKDIQELRVAVFHWFNRYLKGDEERTPIADPAVRSLEPEQLKVFDSLPEDERTTTIHESFVPAAPAPEVPRDADAWAQRRAGALQRLREHVFSGWPDEAPPLELKSAPESEERFTFLSQPEVPITLTVNRRSASGNGLLLAVAGAETPTPDIAVYRLAAAIEPRGVGAGKWTDDERDLTHIRRRFMLLGQTVDSMRVWDIRQGIEAVRSLPGCTDQPVTLQASGEAAVNALYAALFEPDAVAMLKLGNLPVSHRDGPDYLNVQRILDIPEALALAVTHTKIEVTTEDPDAEEWTFPRRVAEAMGHGDALVIRESP